MALQSENRSAESGNEGDKVNYQRFEHPPLDVLTFSIDQSSRVQAAELTATRTPASVRIYCPDIRVVSRIGCIFEPLDPNDASLYNLSQLKNQIVAYRCMNAGNRIARVGEIVGKNGVPLEFPKSNIDGIAFQNEDDMPFIDLDLNLGFPGVPGKWVVYYHATSNNKLKRLEWEGYISRVTMAALAGGGIIKYALPS
jgi:hypothetical protein